MTHREYRLRMGDPLGIPDVSGHEYMIAAFHECGVTKPGAMGDVPLEWPDVLAYAQVSGAMLAGDDAVTLYQMCRAYWGERQAAQDALRIAPTERG